MQKTLHYELKKPEITDPLRVTDFNENNDLIDAAIKAVADTANSKAGAEAVSALQQSLAAQIAAKGNCQIAYGSYTGTGTYGKQNPNMLTFDFKPILVVIGCSENVSTAAWPTIMLRDVDEAKGDYATYTSFLTWLDNGVSWWANDATTQDNEAKSYFYAAVGCAK